MPTCSIPRSSGLKGQERSLSLAQLRYLLFSNSTEFHLIPSSSHSTGKHSQLLLACTGCQTADCLDYTGLYCIPAGPTQSGIRAHCWALPAHQVLSWSWKSRDNRQLLSKHSLLSLSKYKPTPNQLLKQPKVMGNLYSLWLSLLQQRDPVLCFLSRYWKLKPLQSFWQLGRPFSFISTVNSSYLWQSCVLKIFKWP